MPPKYHALTVRGQGLLRAIISPCGIAEAHDPNQPGVQPVYENFAAIWDTGATASVITQSVVDRCGLKPIGLTKVHGVSGETQSEVYLVNISINNNLVCFFGFRVTKGSLAGADVLLGMDVICQGDFSLTNVGGITVCSFRTPSQGHLDYVKEHRDALLKERFKAGHPKTKRGKQGKRFGKHK